MSTGWRDLQEVWYSQYSWAWVPKRELDSWTYPAIHLSRQLMGFSFPTLQNHVLNWWMPAHLSWVTSVVSHSTACDLLSHSHSTWVEPRFGPWSILRWRQREQALLGRYALRNQEPSSEYGDSFKGAAVETKTATVRTLFQTWETPPNISIPEILLLEKKAAP